MTQQERINRAVGRAAKYVGVTKREFTKKHKRWEKCEFSYERALVSYYLHNTTTLSINKISKMLGYAVHTTVMHQINKINDELSDKVYGYDKTKRCYRDLVAYIEEEQ